MNNQILAYGNVIPDFSPPTAGAEALSTLGRLTSIAGSIRTIVEVFRDIDEAKKLMRELEKITKEIAYEQAIRWKNEASRSPDLLVDRSSQEVYGSLYLLLNYLPKWADYARRDWGTSKLYSHTLYDYEMMKRGFDVWMDGLIGFPKTIVKKKMERYWRREVGGLLPSARDLFIMWRKGLISQSTFERLIWETTGFDPEIRTAFIEHLFYDPSIFDLFRVVRNVSVPKEWIKKKLTELGVDDEDLPILQGAVEREALKDEIDRVWASLEADYGWGLYTESELKTILEEWKLSPDEIHLRLTNAKIKRDKTVIKLSRDADLYLLRAGVISPEECYGRLKLLGIHPDIANALVRLEMAKMGVEWNAPAP